MKLSLRENVPGVDPVHTREDEGAEFSRRLAVGWEIGDGGKLEPGASADVVGPGTRRNEYYRSVGARRMMLGASILTQAVPVADPTELGVSGEEGAPVRIPREESLYLAFSTADGWTHEDAFVVSEAVRGRLTRVETLEIAVTVPSRVGRLEAHAPGFVKAGEPLLRGWIDAFAMDLDPGAPALSLAACAARGLDLRAVSRTGWLRVHLDGVAAPSDGWLLGHLVEPLDGAVNRERWHFQFHVRRRLEVGDKLGTPHGLKGIVSQIRPPESMPIVHGRRAEILASPAGIASRLALGQLREMGIGEAALTTPAAGMARIVRLPHEASAKLKIAGPGWRGAKYGWMEFTALMAHGSARIARELLGFDRSTGDWLAREKQLGAKTAQEAACRALTRYLEFFRLPGRRGGSRTLVVRNSRLRLERVTLKSKPLDPSGVDRAMLENPDSFRGAGTLSMALPHTVTLRLPLKQLRSRTRMKPLRTGRRRDQRTLTVSLSEVPIVPPWLRPSVRGRIHPLTAQYLELAALLRRREGIADADGRVDEERLASMRRGIDRSVGAIGQRLLHDDQGVSGFLKASIMERRLTRSAIGVIAPDPQLQLDQIAVPRECLDAIFAGLPESAREFVLVNRYPTLHRYGLVALRPVPVEGGSKVFGMPLGVLDAMGADFDGDSATIVALETPASLREAATLCPGAKNMRLHPFRSQDAGAFRLSRELGDEKEDEALARRRGLSDEEWRSRHFEMQCRRITKANRRNLEDVKTALVERAIDEREEERRQQLRSLWKGMSERAWFALARKKMGIVYAAQDMKANHGAILRRVRQQLLWDGDLARFSMRVAALQSITERVTQSLSRILCKRLIGREPVVSSLKGRDAIEEAEDPQGAAGRVAGRL
jgi:hypothetical protein